MPRNKSIACRFRTASGRDELFFTLNLRELRRIRGHVENGRWLLVWTRVVHLMSDSYFATVAGSGATPNSLLSSLRNRSNCSIAAARFPIPT